LNLLLGAFTIGLILSLLALGVFVSFRVFRFPDITADGSITLGAAVAAVLLMKGMNPVLATLIAAAAGGLAGMATGLLHTRFNINGLLSGILVMTALYSINLYTLGKSNVSLLTATTLASYAQGAGTRMAGKNTFSWLGWKVEAGDLGMLVCCLIASIAIGALLYVFFRTQLGTAMRATGDNPQMMRAQAADVRNMITGGLALSNALIAASGALLAQYQGFTDVQMGIGMVVWGLASVIIGESLVGTTSFGLTIAGAVMGSVLFRLLVAIALRWGMDPNGLKLVTALFVFAALVLPGMIATLKPKKKGTVVP
jgi:putative tryptophan/tyrosine transport system permease protein